MPHRLLRLVLLLVFAAFPGVAFAQIGPTIIIPSNGGGGPFQDKCPESEALVGFNYVIGKDANSIAGVCAELVDGHAVGALFGLTTRGDPNIDYRDYGEGQVRCSSDMVVEGISVRVSKVNLVNTFALICKSVARQTRESTAYAGLGTGEHVAEALASCGGGAIAIGVIGKAGSMVDALGLLCQVVAKPAPVVNNPPPPPNNTPKPKPAPKPDKPPLTVNNGDDDGNDGVDVSAANDTTIYDKPDGSDVAFLSAGDPVTIVKCNSRNWCQISAPEDGWVWGDDLDR